MQSDVTIRYFCYVNYPPQNPSSTPSFNHDFSTWLRLPFLSIIMLAIIIFQHTYTQNQFKSLASVPWLLQLQPSFPKHHLSQPLLQLYLMISMAVSLTRSCRSTKIHTTSENCISTILLFDHPLPSLPFYICGITTIVWLHRVLQTTEPTIFSPSTTLLISFLHLLRFHNSAWESLPYKDLLTLHHS